MMFSIVFAIKTFPKWSYPGVQFFISYIGDMRCCMYKKWNWDQEINFRGMTRSLSNCCNLTSVIGSSSYFCPPVAYYDLQGLHLSDQKETSHLWQRWTGSRTWNNVISAKCTGCLEKCRLKVFLVAALICINHFEQHWNLPCWCVHPKSTFLLAWMGPTCTTVLYQNGSSGGPDTTSDQK